jgi:uncharacterized protein (UPF0333 family)
MIVRLPPSGIIASTGKVDDNKPNNEDNTIRAVIITLVVVIIVIVVVYYLRTNYREHARIAFLTKNFNKINPDINIPDTEVKQIIKNIRFLPVNTKKSPTYSYCLYDKKNIITKCHIAHGNG